MTFFASSFGICQTSGGPRKHDPELPVEPDVLTAAREMSPRSSRAYPEVGLQIACTIGSVTYTQLFRLHLQRMC